jgi:hypothetical protein
VGIVEGTPGTNQVEGGRHPCHARLHHADGPARMAPVEAGPLTFRTEQGSWFQPRWCPYCLMLILTRAATHLMRHCAPWHLAHSLMVIIYIHLVPRAYTTYQFLELDRTNKAARPENLWCTHTAELATPTLDSQSMTKSQCHANRACTLTRI